MKKTTQYAVLPAAIATGVVVLLILTVTFGLWETCHDYEWHVIEEISGNVEVRDKPGWYYSGFASITNYPRVMEAFYSSHVDEGGGDDKSVRCTFNDGGTAQVSMHIRFRTPVEQEKRRIFHREFGGMPSNVVAAVRSHLVNCVKAAAPLMSASENQASRKAEFAAVIQDQLEDGLYEMKQVRKTLDDVAVAVEVKDGEIREKPAEVTATEVVTDDKGNPVIAQPSPLKEYGIQILQFSITEIEYDPDTLKQFSAKKQAFLLAEQAKADRQKAEQERLKIIAEGEAEVARIEAEGNQEKMKATVSADKEAEVAEIMKKKAVTEAMQKVEVAEQQKLETETMKEIALTKKEIAEIEAEAQIKLAEARQKELEIGGAISEESQRLAEIKAERDVKMAEHLAQLKVPNIVIVGPGGQQQDCPEGGTCPGGSQDLQGALINMALLKSLGLLDVKPEDNNVFRPKVKPVIAPAPRIGTASVSE